MSRGEKKGGLLLQRSLKRSSSWSFSATMVQNVWKKRGGARSELTEACNDGGCEMMVMAVLKFVEERERRWKEEEEEERFAWQLASQAITPPPPPPLKPPGGFVR